jgi:1,4-alpha-glucan branching enzyme
MPGDHWQQFANLRLLFGYMYGHPGAKLIFMGGEFAQRHEWQHDFSLDWHENHHPLNNGVQKLLVDLNKLYQQEPALYENNFTHEGFEWIDTGDSTNSVISWIRKGKSDDDKLIFVASFTPVIRQNYRIGVPKMGFYREVFNTDNLKYGGSDILNESNLEAFPVPAHGKSHSLSLTLPPLGLIVLKFAH